MTDAPQKTDPAKRERPRELRLHIIVGIALVVAALGAAAAGVIGPRVLFERRVGPWRERAGLWGYDRDRSSGHIPGRVHYEINDDIITEKGHVLVVRRWPVPRSWAAKLRIISGDEARGEGVNWYGERMTVVLRAQGDGSLASEWMFVGPDGFSESLRLLMTRIPEDGATANNWLLYLEGMGLNLETGTPEELFGKECAPHWREWWEEKAADYRPKKP